ncbi:MAG: hypothetical protein JW849_03485 [Phycisphaerae bacterium]|nr:hypothetical protein [Phycisphaerae bacterium]
MSIRAIRQTTAVLVGSMLLAGCMSIHAPKKVTVGGKGNGQTEKIGKADAYNLAENVARQEGLNVKNYNLENQKTSDGWWILFDHKVNGYKLDWPYHFAVRVTPDGKTSLLTNRAVE